MVVLLGAAAGHHHSLPESRAAGEEEGRWGSAAAAGSPYELPVRTTWGVGGLPSAYVSENSHTLLLLFFF